MIVIPARAGSKGLPFKNRTLFKHTADSIPIIYNREVWVATDDLEIQKMAMDRGYNIIERPSEVSNDTASTKSLMEYIIGNVKPNDPAIVMLYLTYPERKWSEVKDAMDMYLKTGASSLLCKKKIEWTPYLVLKDEGNNKGSQLFEHDLYRRQDYPECFEISHYISIFDPSTINKLNNNMYNEDTVFMEIPNTTLDIDTQKDFDKLK